MKNAFLSYSHKDSPFVEELHRRLARDGVNCFFDKSSIQLGGQVVKEIHELDRSMLPPIQQLPKTHNMPFRSLGNRFIGRVSDIWQIHDILQNKQTAVIEGVGIIMGTGGLGKTQTAIEYVHRLGYQYPGGVFWINAEQGLSEMVNDIKQTAHIDLDPKLNDKAQLAQIWQIMSQLGKVLIVLDNFLENEPLQPWLPPVSSIHTLVTTRRRDLAYGRLALVCMNHQEGLALLNSDQRQFGKAAYGLVDLLGGLPLALELTRHFLNQRPKVSIEQLIHEIQTKSQLAALSIFAKKYADDMPTGHNKEVAATFQMSLDLVSPAAMPVLQVMSMLDATPVPIRLMQQILDKDESDSCLDDPLDDAISELKRLSLIELDQDNDPFMHRLISGFIQSTFSDADLFEKVVSAVDTEMARTHNDTAAYQELEKIVPHAVVLCSSELMGYAQKINIFNSLSGHHRKWGRYQLSKHYGRMALDLSESNYEPGHSEIAISQSNLALVLRDLGQLEEARDLLRMALSSDQKNFEPGHPSIARSLLNLGIVLSDLGQTDKAIEYFNKAVDIDDQYIDAWRHLENCYKQLNNTEIATQLTDKIKEITEQKELQSNINDKVCIQQFEINEVQIFNNIQWIIQPQVNVVLGKNGYGKSHLFRLLLCLIQKNIKKSNEFFIESSNDSYAKCSVKKTNQIYSIIRKRVIFEKSIGKVPVLAIPDSRYVDKSNDLIATISYDSINILHNGANAFIYEKNDTERINDFLYKLCIAYLKNHHSFDVEIFQVIKTVIHKLTGVSFKFKKLDVFNDTAFKLLVELDDHTIVPFQKISQGSLSIIVIVGLIYYFLNALPYHDEKVTNRHGIVFIDEIDAHLHPEWHHKIIPLLKETFPKVQFFLTAHSPLIAAGCRELEVSVLRKNNNGFTLFQFNNHFIGWKNDELFKYISEIEDKDEVYKKYLAMAPFKSNLKKEINDLESMPVLSQQEKKKLKDLYTDIYYINEAIKQREKRLMNSYNV